MNLDYLFDLPEVGTVTPALFIGHGSPMNGIQDNEFSQTWKSLGKTIPRPKAVLVVSAHWLTQGTSVTAMTYPRTIHDFGGFPNEFSRSNTLHPAVLTSQKKPKGLLKKRMFTWITNGDWTTARGLL